MCGLVVFMELLYIFIGGRRDFYKGVLWKLVFNGVKVDACVKFV